MKTKKDFTRDGCLHRQEKSRSAEIAEAQTYITTFQ